jgi:nicotinamide phosphoribosyltransferase
MMAARRPRLGPENPLLLTDSYKMSHWRQYPPGTEAVCSYFESRGGLLPEVAFFGLQYLLKRYLAGPVVSEESIGEAEAVARAHFRRDDVFNLEGWLHIVRDHAGRLPVSVRAVPEGTVVPVRNVLMTVESTCERCFWLTNCLETLLVQSWYPSTVATKSREMKRMILRYLQETGDPSGVGFKLHDFGFRGVSSPESAALGGAAHLVNFLGTDTMAGLLLARDFYGAEMAGFSIPAAEHSTITAWGRDGEAEAMKNMLEQWPRGLVACVSDSYDIFRACDEIWGKALRSMVMERDGTLVVRPDSGDPPTVVRRVVEILGERFGWEKNAKGYRVLDPHVRVLQGDGVDLASAERVLAALKAAGWSADNLAFGMGGALLQRLHRDTQKMAFKTSAVRVRGEWRDVFKEPVTDPGKNSKRGRLALVAEGHGLRTMRREEAEARGLEDFLVEVFRDGDVVREWTFDEVRRRAEVRD